MKMKWPVHPCPLISCSYEADMCSERAEPKGLSFWSQHCCFPSSRVHHQVGKCLSPAKSLGPGTRSSGIEQTLAPPSCTLGGSFLLSALASTSIKIRVFQTMNVHTLGTLKCRIRGLLINMNNSQHTGLFCHEQSPACPCMG